MKMNNDLDYQFSRNDALAEAVEAYNQQCQGPELGSRTGAIDQTQTMIAEVCDEIKKILLQKNSEYGDSAINPRRIFSGADPIEQINVRIDDKLSRIANRKEKTIHEDTELDLIGYLILKRVAIRRIGG